MHEAAVERVALAGNAASGLYREKNPVANEFKIQHGVPRYIPIKPGAGNRMVKESVMLSCMFESFETLVSKPKCGSHAQFMVFWRPAA